MKKKLILTNLIQKNLKKLILKNLILKNPKNINKNLVQKFLLNKNQISYT